LGLKSDEDKIAFLEGAIEAYHVKFNALMDKYNSFHFGEIAVEVTGGCAKARRLFHICKEAACGPTTLETNASKEAALRQFANLEESVREIVDRFGYNAKLFRG
jgi:hypothetical protein